MTPITIKPGLEINERDLGETFMRASGPGGQNVNKVETAVQLRFDVRASQSLTPDVKARLIRLAGTRVTKEGALVIEAQRFRSRERNREDARARLVELIRKAMTPPRPRRKTTIPNAVKKKRLSDKRRRSEVKARRGRVRDGDG